MIYQMRRIKGLTLFEFNKITKELKPATIKYEIGKSKVVYQKDCLYLQALNLNNAKRKLQKLNLL